MSCRRLAFLLVAGLLVASGCSTTRPGGADREEEPGEPVTETVQGYRIQILTTPERERAYAAVEEAMAWWETVPAGRRAPHLGDDELEAEVVWRQPYYRVRVGGFATRAEAERALAVVDDAYPDALVVPDVVTVAR